MAYLKEEAKWEEGIRMIEETDPVMGGEYGVDNIAPRQLANRTLYLKQQIEQQNTFMKYDDAGNVILCGRNDSDADSSASNKDIDTVFDDDYLVQ